MILDLALIQFRATKADPRSSLQSIAAILRAAKEGEPPADLVVFPEAALTGYALEGGVREHAWTARELFRALQEIHDQLPGAGEPLDVVVGFYERRDHRIYNAAMYAELGGDSPRIVHVHRKVFLPTYGLFQEERFLQAGHTVEAFQTRWGRAALLVCEDLFHSLSATLAALDGAELILVASAAPARGPGGTHQPESLDRWERVVRATSEEHGIYVAVSQLVGFEGGKGFAGRAMVSGPDGRVLARAPLWEEATVRVRLDMGALDRARFHEPLLGDLERALPRLMAGRHPGTLQRQTGEPAAGEGPAPEGAPHPGDLAPLEIHPPLVEEWLTRFLREEVRERRGFQRVVVALSGGLDSATTAVLCARAFGPDAVTGLLMPTDTTPRESLEDARSLVEELGIAQEERDISGAVDAVVEASGPGMDDLRRGNVAARVRMVLLFDRSKALGALPVGTGNKSERLLGYFTWHADDTPPVNPLGDLFKVQVRQLARHLGVPERILAKRPSAELEPGQSDEEDLGVSYETADPILHHLLEGHDPEELVERGFSEQAVWTVHGRLEGTHWKRHLPTVAVLSSRAAGESYLRPVDY